MSQQVDIKDELPVTALIEHKPEDLTGFLDYVCAILRHKGAQHILITGLPLPGKAIGELIYRNQWGRSESDNCDICDILGSDILLRKIAGLATPQLWQYEEAQSWLEVSRLIEILAENPADQKSLNNIIGIHVHRFNRVQMAIIAAGETLRLSEPDLYFLSCQCQVTMFELDSARRVEQTRSGELSNRERHVLALTAQGKTANHIAEELRISQRTVHAHLQNASEKLQASNKTQTVIEAVRYGQIELS
ncbi:MAG TPA: helix-turn-helix transcriptional regulator [Rhizobiales bacterium]|nr:helix-turn-helix transcriptional regulator [Hyphomicrobiales bacterium]